jgi:hypothetical protein
MTAFKKLLVVLLATLPIVTFAQEAAPAPKPATPTIQFYGFAHLAAQLMGGTSAAQEYPTQGVENQSTGGSFIESARQSRLGARIGLDDGNWTGATLSSVFEFDFNGGSIPTVAYAGPNTTTIASTPAKSTIFYNGLMRLRHANMTATWKVPTGTLAVEAGQDWDIVNNVTAESIAYQATPLFANAGNLYRRAPQIRVTSDNWFGDFGVNLAVAALSPSDANGQPFDNGEGNKSRGPDLEGRLALGMKGDIGGTVGVGYFTTKRRFNAGQFAVAAASQTDVTASLVGIDADLNLTKYLNARGEYYSGKGIDDSFAGIGPGTTGVQNVTLGTGLVGFATNSLVAVKSDGFWVQGILKPIPEIWVTIGYGNTSINQADLKKSLGNIAALSATTRTGQDMTDAALIVNASKAWRFGLEYSTVDSKYDGANGTTQVKKVTIQQINLASQFRF